MHIVTPPIVKDKLIVFPFIAAVILLVAGFSFAYIRLADVHNLLIIHFDSFRGIDFLGDKNDVFGILLMGLLMAGVNGFLANIFYFRERFLSYLLSFGSALICLLILIAVLAIIAIN